MSSEMVVLQDSRLDPDRFILEGVDISKSPDFSVSQLGEFFFARTSHWIRWVEDHQKNVLGGDPSCPHHLQTTKEVDDEEEGSTPKTVKSIESWVGDDNTCSRCGGKQVGMRKTKTGYRTYNLAEIEQYIHALLASNTINGAQATNALHLVQTIAKIHGLIP